MVARREYRRRQQRHRQVERGEPIEPPQPQPPQHGEHADGKRDSLGQRESVVDQVRREAVPAAAQEVALVQAPADVEHQLLEAVDGRPRCDGLGRRAEREVEVEAQAPEREQQAGEPESPGEELSALCRERETRRCGDQNGDAQVVREAQPEGERCDVGVAPPAALGVGEPRSERAQEEDGVQRVDLGDHGLRPEHARERADTGCSERRGRVSAQAPHDAIDQEARDGRGHSGEQVHAPRRASPRNQRLKQVAEQAVHRIAGRVGDAQEVRRRRELSAIAEVDGRAERSPVDRKRNSERQQPRQYAGVEPSALRVGHRGSGLG